MAKYTIFFFFVFLTLYIVSCDQITNRLMNTDGDEFVMEKHAEPDTEYTTFKPPLTTSMGADHSQSMNEHFTNKISPGERPVSSTENFSDRLPHVEGLSQKATALELTLMELAIELRLKDKPEPARRAQLERELVKLRLARQQLYQRRLEN